MTIKKVPDINGTRINDTRINDTLIEVLVLDFGGVISQTLFETHRQTEHILKLAKNSLTWQGPFNPSQDELWQSMLREEISERDYWLYRAKEVGEMVGKNWTTMQEFVLAARAGDPMAIIRPEFLHAISKVKQTGKRLAILSNELDLFYGADFRQKLPFLDDFEVIIDATYTKILKPDPRAYHLMTELLLIKPKKCLFVDDQCRNVQAAERFGMQTVHFDVTRPKDSYANVLSLLGIE